MAPQCQSTPQRRKKLRLHLICPGPTLCGSPALRGQDPTDSLDLSDHCYLQPLDSGTADLPGGCSLSSPRQPLRFKLECRVNVTSKRHGNGAEGIYHETESVELNCPTERLSDISSQSPACDGRKFSVSAFEWEEPRLKKKAPTRTTAQVRHPRAPLAEVSPQEEGITTHTNNHMNSRRGCKKKAANCDKARDWEYRRNEMENDAAVQSFNKVPSDWAHCLQNGVSRKNYLESKSAGYAPGDVVVTKYNIKRKNTSDSRADKKIKKVGNSKRKLCKNKAEYTSKKQKKITTDTKENRGKQLTEQSDTNNNTIAVQTIGSDCIDSKEIYARKTSFESLDDVLCCSSTSATSTTTTTTITRKVSNVPSVECTGTQIEGSGGVQGCEDSSVIPSFCRLKTLTELGSGRTTVKNTNQGNICSINRYCCSSDNCGGTCISGIETCDSNSETYCSCAKLDHLVNAFPRFIDDDDDLDNKDVTVKLKDYEDTIIDNSLIKFEGHGDLDSDVPLFSSIDYQGKLDTDGVSWGSNKDHDDDIGSDVFKSRMFGNSNTSSEMKLENEVAIVLIHEPDDAVENEIIITIQDLRKDDQASQDACVALVEEIPLVIQPRCSVEESNRSLILGSNKKGKNVKNLMSPLEKIVKCVNKKLKVKSKKQGDESIVCMPLSDEEDVDGFRVLCNIKARQNAKRSYISQHLCRSCLLLFPTIKKLRAHKTAHHHNCAYQCQFCQRLFGSEGHFFKHLEHKHKMRLVTPTLEVKKRTLHACQGLEKRGKQNMKVESNWKPETSVQEVAEARDMDLVVMQCFNDDNTKRDDSVSVQAHKLITKQDKSEMKLFSSKRNKSLPALKRLAQQAEVFNLNKCNTFTINSNIAVVTRRSQRLATRNLNSTQTTDPFSSSLDCTGNHNTRDNITAEDRSNSEDMCRRMHQPLMKPGEKGVTLNCSVGEVSDRPGSEEQRYDTREVGGTHQHPAGDNSHTNYEPNVIHKSLRGNLSRSSSRTRHIRSARLPSVLNFPPRPDITSSHDSAGCCHETITSSHDSAECCHETMPVDLNYDGETCRDSPSAPTCRNPGGTFSFPTKTPMEFTSSSRTVEMSQIVFPDTCPSGHCSKNYIRSNTDASVLHLPHESVIYPLAGVTALDVLDREASVVPCRRGGPEGSSRCKRILAASESSVCGFYDSLSGGTTAAPKTLTSKRGRPRGSKNKKSERVKIMPLLQEELHFVARPNDADDGVRGRTGYGCGNYKNSGHTHGFGAMKSGDVDELLPTVATQVLVEKIEVDDFKDVFPVVENVEVSEHKVKKFTCSVCDRVMKSVPSLKYHMETHSKKTYECEVCHRHFQHKINLKAHSKIHIEKQFKCDQCLRKFRTNFLLQRHVQEEHLRIVAYSCKDCNMTFTRYSSLSIHRRVHSSNRRFECPSCQVVFSRNQHLALHSAQHRLTETRNYMLHCLVCPNIVLFRSYMSLRKHHRSQHQLESLPAKESCKLFIEDRPYVCPDRHDQPFEVVTSDTGVEVVLQRVEGVSRWATDTSEPDGGRNVGRDEVAESAVHGGNLSMNSNIKRKFYRGSNSIKEIGGVPTKRIGSFGSKQFKPDESKQTPSVVVEFNQPEGYCCCQSRIPTSQNDYHSMMCHGSLLPCQETVLHEDGSTNCTYAPSSGDRSRLQPDVASTCQRRLCCDGSEDILPDEACERSNAGNSHGVVEYSICEKVQNETVLGDPFPHDNNFDVLSYSLRSFSYIPDPTTRDAVLSIDGTDSSAWITEDDSAYKTDSSFYTDSSVCLQAVPECTTNSSPKAVDSTCLQGNEPRNYCSNTTAMHEARNARRYLTGTVLENGVTVDICEEYSIVADTGGDVNVVDTGGDVNVVDTGVDVNVVDTGVDVYVLDTGVDVSVVDTGVDVSLVFGHNGVSLPRDDRSSNSVSLKGLCSKEESSAVAMVGHNVTLSTSSGGSDDAAINILGHSNSLATGSGSNDETSATVAKNNIAFERNEFIKVVAVNDLTLARRSTMETENCNAPTIPCHRSLSGDDGKSDCKDGTKDSSQNISSGRLGNENACLSRKQTEILPRHSSFCSMQAYDENIDVEEEKCFVRDSLVLMSVGDGNNSLADQCEPHGGKILGHSKFTNQSISKRATTEADTDCKLESEDTVWNETKFHESNGKLLPEGQQPNGSVLQGDNPSAGHQKTSAAVGVESRDMDDNKVDRMPLTPSCASDKQSLPPCQDEDMQSLHSCVRYRLSLP